MRSQTFSSILGIQALWLSAILFLHVTTALAPSHGSNCQKSPGLVHLGYAKHVPSFVNTTASGKKLTVYKNIRFGKSPTGNLRFRKPDTRLDCVEEIQNGLVPPGETTECISAAPSWVPLPVPGLNGTAWGREDCLFLDVWVPEGVKPGDKLPVLHWIHGSAYAFSSKETNFSPVGLFDRMEEGEKFIFVANNYRMGMSGWTYVPGQDMDANVGLQDCLAAGEWIAKYIDRFGGDPKKVTAMGQSAGAGILQYLTTWNGGRGWLPFQQIFLSSASYPHWSLSDRTKGLQQQLFQDVLDAANCTDLACLRSAPEDVIFRANRHLINEMPPGGVGGFLGPDMGFGPVPDGKTIPDMPVVSFRKGRYHKEIKSVIVGTMANDGMGSADGSNMPAGFPRLVRTTLPGASNKTVAEIQALYPHYEDPSQLAWDWTTDVFFACSAYNLAEAYADKTRRYIMSVPPAVHGMDGFYYFHVNQQETPVPNPEVAFEFQDRLIRLLNGGDKSWPKYGEAKRLFNITLEGGFEGIRLPVQLAKRCKVITNALLDPANGVA